MADKLSKELIVAFGEKIRCEAEFIKIFDTMRRGDADYSLSQLASALEHCDDSQKAFWATLRKDIKKAKK